MRLTTPAAILHYPYHTDNLDPPELHPSETIDIFGADAGLLFLFVREYHHLDGIIQIQLALG